MRRRFVSIALILVLLTSIMPVYVFADEADYPTFNGTLRISEEGIAMLQDLEGYIRIPTWDVAQNSIGYGCSTKFAEKYGFSVSELTKDEALQLMLFVLDEMEDSLDAFLDKYDIEVNQYQYDALISFTYNLGSGFIDEDTRIGKLLIDGNYTVNQLASAFGIYCHTGSGKNAKVLDHLVSRRIRETKLFLYGAYNLEDVDEKFCRLTYIGNVPPSYSDIGLYQEGQPYQILFEPDPSSGMPGLYFEGWFTEYGEPLTPDMIVEDNLKVYAGWSEYPVLEPIMEIEQDPYVCTDWLQLTEKEYVDGVIVGSEDAGPDAGEADDKDIPEDYVEASDRFSDVAQDQWYYDYVNDLVNRGIINGYEDSTFRPNNDVTTGEALKMILLASGFAEPEPVESHWARGYLDLALEFGILDSGDITDLDIPISRELMAKITANSLVLEPLYDTSAFTDTDSLYATILSDHGLSEGYEDGTFRPEKSLTRAELSTIVWRIDLLFG